MIVPRSFSDDLQLSFAHTPVDRHLLATAFGVSPANVRQTGYIEDKAGTDWKVYTPRGVFGVDVKRRSPGAARWWRSLSSPDLIVERWSKREWNIAGPLWRDDPLPAYWGLVYSDIPDRIDLIEAQPLRVASRRNYDAWARKYGERRSVTQTIEYGPFTTIWTPVPLPVVVSAIAAVS